MSVARVVKGWLPVLVVGALATVAVACASASEGINARLATVQADIDRALAADELEAARELAVEFEYRLPGGDSFAAYGDVLWRLGDLIEAEAFHRRAVEAGVPRGYRGLARARLARGNYDEAIALARRAAELPEIADSARMTEAAAAWATGRVSETAGALGAVEPQGDGVIAQEAAILGGWPATEAPADGDAWRSPVEWVGGPAAMAMAPSGRVEVRVGGIDATLRIRLDGTRSSISPQLAGRVSQRTSAEGDAIGAPLTLGTLRTAAAVFRVHEPEPGEDGVLGFDLLSTLAWMIDVRDGVVQLARAGEQLPPGIDPPVLASTHWATVRVPRRGLAAELLVIPRVRGEVVRATLDLGGGSRIAERVLPSLYRDDTPPELTPGDIAELELRVGAWRGPIEWTVEDLVPLGHGGRVAPQAVIGSDFLVGWRVRWRPDRFDLRLERHDDVVEGPIQ